MPTQNTANSISVATPTVYTLRNPALKVMVSCPSGAADGLRCTVLKENQTNNPIHVAGEYAVLEAAVSHVYEGEPHNRIVSITLDDDGSTTTGSFTVIK